MKVKEESEKVGLKLNSQKPKLMASGPITSWKIDRETVSDFILGGLQNQCRCVRSRVRHYWQNGGMVPSLISSFCRHRSRDERFKPCNSDLSFPLSGWVNWKGILRYLLLLSCMSSLYILDTNLFPDRFASLQKESLSGAVLGINQEMEARPQTPLLIPQARSWDEGVRPCNSDLFFPFLGWVDWKEY